MEVIQAALLLSNHLKFLRQALEVSADLDMGKVFPGRRAGEVLSDLPAVEHAVAH